MKIKVVFFGNSQSVFSNRHFHALVATPCELVGVVDVPPTKRMSTNPATTDFPSFVEVARRQGALVFEPADPNLQEFVKAMSNLSVDLFIAVGYTNLLKQQLLSVPQILAVNFHASLLPAYRGKHPVFWALRNGERWSGLTVHVMDIGLDTGDILYQIRVRTRKNDSVATLYERIMAQSVKLVGGLIKDAEKGMLRRTPQPQQRRGSVPPASYYSSVHEDDFRLDWSKEAEQLRRWIQTSPGQCFCDIAGKRVFFMDAKVVAGMSDATPGALIRIGRTTCTVAAGKDSLRVRGARVDNEGEKSMPQLCRELGLEEGDFLV